jgi:DNA polymerase-3 subunit beta
MKLTIDKGALMVPLYRTQGVADRKASTNVLACIHMEASDGTLTFTATDYDVTITAEVTAEVEQPGAALVNGRTLFDVVRALPEGVMVQMTADDNHRLRIEAGRAYYHLNGLAPEEFPAIEEESRGKSLLVDKDQFESMLRRTLFSVSNDETRPSLNGVLLEVEAIEGDENRANLRMVSTDGHRLSKVERAISAKDYDGSEYQCIIHRNGAGQLQRIFEGGDEPVRIEFLGRNVVFNYDQTRLQVRQIEEAFPEYQRVIPDKGDVVVTMAKDEFLSAIRRVSSLSTGKHNLLRFDLENGKISLEMVHADFGDAHEELQAPEYEGSLLSIGFNPRYLVDICGVLESQTLSLEMSDQFSPCLVRSDEEPGSLFVVMPMRL